MGKSTSNQRISLNGDWAFSFAEEGHLVESDVVSGKEGMQWLPCEVPGSAQLDLLRHGLIPDPFYGMNTEDIRKYECYEWWYKTTFRVPAELRGKRQQLLFHGLDTLARVWLNGTHIGDTDNMFVPHGFDVTDRINEHGDNELVVRFSPARSAIGRELSGCYASMGTYESLRIRKARHAFGWDIARQAGDGRHLAGCEARRP